MRKFGGLARDFFWAAIGLSAATIALLALIELERNPIRSGYAQRFDHAQLAVAGHVPPAPDSPNWSRVGLPHTLRDLPVPVGSAWYLMRFYLGEVPAETQALLLPHLRLNAEVFLNDQRLGDPSAMQSPIARRTNEPRLLTLQPQTLRKGENLLLVHLVTEPAGFGSLGRVYFGSRKELLPAYQRLYLLKVTMPLLALPLMIGMGLLFAVLWWRRRDATFGFFVLCTVAWVVETLDFCIVNPPLPARLWDWLLFVSLGWMSVCWVHFVHRLTGTRHALLERLALVYGVLYSCTALIPDHRLLWLIASTVGNPINGLCCLYGCVRFWLASRRGQPDVYLLWVITLSGYVFGVWDTIAVGPFWLGSESRFLYLAVPLMLAAVARSLLVGFMRVLSQAESLNRELEARVAAKTREIEASQERLRGVEVESRLLAERSRIMYDMHDGVGGQLVATLAGVRNGGLGMGEVAENLSATIDDLRLVIDSLDPENTSLPALLSSLRGRLQRQVAPLGMALQWPSIAELERLPPLRQEQALQLVRVVQEATTNAIKHSRARTLTVAVSASRLDGHGAVCVEIVDDGVGLHAAEAGANKGRGLASMRERARRQGGELEIESAAGGTRLRLRLPIP